MSWTEIEIDESGKITVRRGGTLTGKAEKPPYIFTTEPEPKPMAEPEPEPKPKLVTWRRCVRIEPKENYCRTFVVEWWPSGGIPKHWYPIESHTQPIETVQQLPEGEHP